MHVCSNRQSDSNIYMEMERAKKSPGALHREDRLECVALLESETFNKGTTMNTVRHWPQSRRSDP